MSRSTSAPGATAPPTVDAPTVDAALGRACQTLLARQDPDGFWCGDLEADSVLESEYVLLLHFLGEGDSPRARKAGRRIRRLQRESGGWAIYPGGPDDVSASVKAYYVLKLLGDSSDAAHMRAARRAILDLGGIEATNTYTRIYLALFGQYPWRDCPAIPPEMVLLPRWFPFNLYEMSSWSRAIFVPLSILWGLRVRREIPGSPGVPELRTGGARPEDPREAGPRGRRWRAFFLNVDRMIKQLERSGVRPLRDQGLEAAEQWILDRQEGSDGLGAIFPGIVNAIMALDALGYPRDHPAVQHELRGLERLIVEEADALRLQPTRSPVWDTAQALSSLAAAGVRPDHPSLRRAARWLLDREVRTEGDWTYGNPEAPPGGWYFEFANEAYPDCDDTAEVLAALTAVDVGADPGLASRVDDARRRGLRWLLSMQNPDGGWAAFDRGCDNEALRWVPFADHNAMLDPSCPDITGRVLRLLAREGSGPDDPAVARGIRYLVREQNPDGTWYGRWGCNYIYGTWLALEALAAHDAAPERRRRAAGWLRGCQNDDGGWGESLATYDDPDAKGRGPSTAAQTAWAVLGLLAAADGESGDALRRGVGHLLRTQRDDGSWHDAPWTGTGFPRVFYLRYGLYDLYFPILALGTYLNTNATR